MADPATPLPRAPSLEPLRWPPWPEVAYPVWPEDLSRWFIPEDDDMTWTTLLIALQRHLFASLRKLLAEQNRDWFVGYEQKMLLDAKDQRIDVVPDLYVLPCQPKDTNFFQWPAYLPDIPVPVFALEVVSGSNWDKDYQGSPQRYAKLGVEELLIFDPLAQEGKSPASPPHVLQLYRQGKKGELKRVYAGEGPVWSEEMRVWFRAEGGRLTVTRDREGKSAVLTAEETERWWDKLEEERSARKKAEEKAEQERSAKEAAEEQTKQAHLAKEAAEKNAQQERLAKEEAEAKAEEERLAKEAAKKAQRTAEEKTVQERRAGEDALREAIVDLCEMLVIDLTPDRLAHLASLDLAALRDLRAHLKLRKTWPD
jgi:Uma2 family endonuclease